MRRNLRELADPALFEATFVVLGVVLALAANEWRHADQSRYEHQARSIGEVIYGELYRNGVEGVTGNYRNLSNLIGAFLYREKQLIAVYDTTLQVTR